MTIDEYQTTHWQANDEYQKVLEQLHERIELKNADKLKQLHDALVSSIAIEEVRAVQYTRPQTSPNPHRLNNKVVEAAKITRSKTPIKP